MKQIVAILVVIAACTASPGSRGGGGGGGGGDGGVGSGSDITVQQFIEQLVTQNCQQAYKCMAQYPANATDTFADLWGTSEADCVSSDDDYTARNALAMEVTAGTMMFDPAEAKACLGNPAFPASCTDFFNTYAYPDACYNALSGNVADGGACISDFECTGDTSSCEMGKCAPSP